MRRSVIKDHDLLVLTPDVPAAGLEAGDVGVVVAVYGKRLRVGRRPLR
jgi:hypothetical protein